MGDVGSMANYAQNLGAMLFYLGEPASAAEHYESAARLASRAGRLSTNAQARSNLAHLHIYFGLYERAKAEVNAVLEYAREARPASTSRRRPPCCSATSRRAPATSSAR